MRENSIVFGQIHDRAATIQGKGIGPDTDTIGVIISSLDRVCENQWSITGAWSIRRRPVVTADSQRQLRCSCFIHNFTESDCRWYHVSTGGIGSIQKIVLNTRTGYRHGAAYWRWRSIVIEWGACIYRSGITGGIGNIGRQCVIVSVSQGLQAAGSNSYCSRIAGDRASIICTIKGDGDCLSVLGTTGYNGDGAGGIVLRGIKISTPTGSNAGNGRDQRIDCIVCSCFWRTCITGEVGITSGQRKRIVRFFLSGGRGEGSSPGDVVAADHWRERSIGIRDVGSSEFYNYLRKTQRYRSIIADLKRRVGESEVVHPRCLGIHHVAIIVRYCVVCESGIVTGRITDRAIIQGNGISPDTDAIGVIISSLDRVCENQRSITGAWSIRRRPVIAADSQSKLRCTSYWYIFTESDCHWDIVSNIQQVVLNTSHTGYRHAAYSWRCGVAGYCEVVCCITGVAGKVGFPDVELVRGAVGHSGTVAPACPGYSCIIKLGGAVVYLHTWSRFVGPGK